MLKYDNILRVYDRKYNSIITDYARNYLKDRFPFGLHFIVIPLGPKDLSYYRFNFIIFLYD